MAGKTGLGCLLALGAVGLIGGGAIHVYNKVHNTIVDIETAKSKNELNERIIENQNKRIEELEKKLKEKKEKSE